jgi:ABC-type Fe3+-siderophore transport system permease subunit
MRRIHWLALGVILGFALPIVNVVYKWKRGKPLANSNVLGWISFCLFCLGLTLAAGASSGVLLNFTIPGVAISGLYLLLIHPRLFGRRERSRPPDE